MKHSWLKEKDAADKLGYNPEWFRRLVKQGALDISYTHTNGRKFQYCEKSIEKQLLKNAKII